MYTFIYNILILHIEPRFYCTRSEILIEYNINIHIYIYFSNLILKNIVLSQLYTYVCVYD